MTLSTKTRRASEQETVVFLIPLIAICAIMCGLLLVVVKVILIGVSGNEVNVVGGNRI